MFFIRAGSLFCLENGRETEFQSPFAQEYLDQENSNWDQDSWKYKERDEPSMVPRGMLWGGRGQQNKPVAPKATALFVRGSRLYYILEMSRSNGLFYFDLQTRQEFRLFHRAEFQPRGLFVREDYSILTTTSNPDSSVHLLALDENGKPGPTLTSGDCIDASPFQVGESIYYQSSGLARTEQGAIVAQAPSAINRLDLRTGMIETVLESPDHDYLLPQALPDGTLYCIEAPCTRAARISLLTAAIDIVLFPLRLAVAIFAFLNVFSLFFAKKPLKTAGGPPVPEADLNTRMIHYRLVDIDAVQKRERKRVAVSRDWKLIRISAGVKTEIAANVVWFCLDERGGCVITNGYAISGADGGKPFQSSGLVTALAAAASAHSLAAPADQAAATAGDA